MFFAWASAFCLLLFMYQGLGLFPTSAASWWIFWFTGSLRCSGVQRLLVLRLYRAWMKRGMYLQRTVILGFTESGMHLAGIPGTQPRHPLRHHRLHRRPLRAGPENYNSLPPLGNTKDLEKLIRQEQVDQVLVALPWFAEGRIGAIVHRLRQVAGERPAGAGHGCLPACPQPHRRCLRGSPCSTRLVARGWSPLIRRCGTWSWRASRWSSSPR
ncbi:nucleoside-diphosphate sugar epimerase/dehydratase [Pseudomonas aeruginosa]